MDFAVRAKDRAPRAGGVERTGRTAIEKALAANIAEEYTLRRTRTAVFNSRSPLMRKVKTLAITLLCAVTLAASSTAMGAPRKRGYAPCCKMKHCCYKDRRCCKKANHACCTGKHTNGQGCCCKKGMCPMPEQTGQATDKWVPPVAHPVTHH
jgi:hypothetical protein